jgi:hypothetical protein
MANNDESSPSRIATATVNEATVAVWLEGIPPVRHITISTSSRKRFFRPLKRITRTLIIWARIQLVRDDRKIVFSNKGLMEKVCIDKGRDIILRFTIVSIFVKGHKIRVHADFMPQRMLHIRHLKPTGSGIHAAFAKFIETMLM